MERHYNKYHEKLKYQCTKCDLKFSNKANLKNHLYKEKININTMSIKINASNLSNFISITEKINKKYLKSIISAILILEKILSQ